MKKINFNDSWVFEKRDSKARKKISLPHDAMQEEDRVADSPSGSGGAFYKGGSYEYEKEFWVPEDWENKEVIFEFEGVYPSATVYINQEEAGSCLYGYSNFYIKARNLVYGANNTLKVVADNSKIPNSRWYSGAGIYRSVWMWLGDRKHIVPDGIQIRTLSYKSAKVLVETKHTGGEVKVEILYQGETVATAFGEKTEIKIPKAKLWSHKTPELYQCKVSLIEDEKILDEQIVNFGIRKIEWNKEGLWINGKNTLLKGGCIHHDNGILGARSFAKSEWRRIERLKEAGFNAIRSSHNPVCKDVLEACDALGMYVIDEGWDMWYISKNEYDYATYFQNNYENDVKAMVAKNYNHPSVIMYSIGNEVSEPAEEKGVELAQKLVDLFHSLDDSRPVTAGINLMIIYLKALQNQANKGQDKLSFEDPNQEQGQEEKQEINSTIYNKMVSEYREKMVEAANTKEADDVSSPVLDLLDIAGYNYASGRYEMEKENHPDRIVVGSETYPWDLPNNWKKVEKYPYLIGDFMWTAWDYLGEAGIGAWSYDSEDISFEKKYPWLLSEAGVFDILGNDTAEAGMTSVVWGARQKPYIGVKPVNRPGIEPVTSIWRGTNAFPYWSYKGCDGNEAEVEIYSPGDYVELFINDRSIGVEKLSGYKAVFKTVYQPGILKAVAYNQDGTVHSQSQLVSADGDSQISIRPEEKLARVGDILYLDISVIGDNGEVECNRDATISLTVEGGELLAFGSANPKTTEDFLAGKYTTYYGRSQAVVKVLDEEIGVHASAEGMKKVSKRVKAIKE